MEEFMRRREEELTRPRPNDEVDSGLVAADPRWRYRTKVLSADFSFRYEVFVERTADATASAWSRVGSEYCATLWGARLAARKIRRRHIRRFGR
jgi:hypothetical protein